MEKKWTMKRTRAMCRAWWGLGRGDFYFQAIYYSPVIVMVDNTSTL